MSIDLPAGELFLDRRVLAALSETGPRGGTVSDLHLRLTLAVSPAAVEASLQRLEGRGEAVAWSRRWYAQRHTQWSVGTVGRVGEVGARLRTRSPGDPGAAVALDGLKGALEGDLVLFKKLGKRRLEIRGQHLPAASVVKILKRRYHRLVGSVEVDREGSAWLVPFDSRSSWRVEVEGGAEIPAGEMVVVELDPPSARGPRGRVVEILGDPEVPGVDVRVVLRHHGIDDAFPREVRGAAEALPDDPDEDEIRGREDLTSQVLVTIDGASARDFDDAVSVERLEGGLLRLGVHIADVSAYVAEGSLLDLEAFRRGTSVYFPDRAVPMLPERLSNGLCSLRPDVPRLTLSAFLDIDREGHVHRCRFAETVIRSRRRLTYEEVRRLLEEGAPGDRREYGPVLGLLRQLEELMHILHRARVGRGSIDFDLPAGDVILDTDGYVVGVKPQGRTVAHRIIEECMIAANEAVARELFEAEVPALYRVHDAPDAEHLADLRDTLEPLGVSLEGDLESLHPDRLQAILRQVEGSPEEAFVTTLVLRALQRALYDKECRGHYALASRYYTHFTSPIRRYPDLVVHRRLKAHLQGTAGEEAASSLFEERLDGIAEHTSLTERRAEQAERDILQWKKVRFLAHRVGETFPGRITGVQPFGLFIQLDDLYVDGLVHIGTLDDYYVFEPESHRLLGQGKGRVFQLADRVEVRLTGIDHRNRGLVLELATPAPRRRRDRRVKKKAGGGS